MIGHDFQLILISYRAFPEIVPPLNWRLVTPMLLQIRAEVITNPEALSRFKRPNVTQQYRMRRKTPPRPLTLLMMFA